MTLPTTGAITASMINVELGRAADAPFSLNDSAVRALAGKASGAISFGDFYGKSSYVREPATGENYSNLYRWESGKDVGYTYIVWNGVGVVNVDYWTIVSIVKDGWRYHRGNWRTDETVDEWDIVNIYGVWRETAGADQATYVEIREPEEGGHYSATHRWRETAGNVGYVTWDGVESFVGTGGFSSYEEGGWAYYKGDFVEKYPNNSSGDNYYKIYRSKIEEWTPPPFREPLVGEEYKSRRRVQVNNAGMHYLTWDTLISVNVGTDMSNGFESADWVYYKGGFAQYINGQNFFNIYRVKKASVTTKAREPATGETYDQSQTRWIVNETLGNCYPVWYQDGKTPTLGDVDFVEIDGWRYHKGAYKTNIGSLKYYGVWREEI